MKYLLGLDLGTTKCKCMLLGEDGEIYADSSVGCELIFTPEGVEQNAENWWNDAASAIRRLLCASGANPGDIAAMSVSSQGISGVPVDSCGAVLHNALSWLDARSGAETEELKNKFGEKRMYELTGKNAYSYSFPQLMWIKNNMPEVYSKTWKYMLPLDYLNFRLTGKAVMDLSMASGTYAFDVSAHEWIDQIFSDFGIPKGIFSDIGRMGAAIGHVSSKACEQTGLSEETLVVLGAQDQRCAAIGAGIGFGRATISLGTSAAVCSLVDRPLLDPSRSVTCCAVDDGHWMLESVTSTACAALDWAKDVFFSGHSIKEIDDMAALAPKGAGGVAFVPNLSEGDKKTGGTLSGLTLKTTKNDIARAVLEGIASQIGEHIAHHERVNPKIDEIVLFGGGAASEIWRQIISDTTKKAVLVPQIKETAALGAAVIAGACAGFWDSCWDGCKTIIKNRKVNSL